MSLECGECEMDLRGGHDPSCSRHVSKRAWKKGETGLLRTSHKSDGDYSARARLMHDSPPDQEEVKVKLLEPFYCLDEGDTTKAQRYLFEPGADFLE